MDESQGEGGGREGAEREEVDEKSKINDWMCGRRGEMEENGVN